MPEGKYKLDPNRKKISIPVNNNNTGIFSPTNSASKSLRTPLNISYTPKYSEGISLRAKKYCKKT